MEKIENCLECFFVSFGKIIKRYKFTCASLIILVLTLLFWSYEIWNLNRLTTEPNDTKIYNFFASIGSIATFITLIYIAKQFHENRVKDLHKNKPFILLKNNWEFTVFQGFQPDIETDYCFRGDHIKGTPFNVQNVGGTPALNVIITFEYDNKKVDKFLSDRYGESTVKNSKWVYQPELYPKTHSIGYINDKYDGFSLEGRSFFPWSLCYYLYRNLGGGTKLTIRIQYEDIHRNSYTLEYNSFLYIKPVKIGEEKPKRDLVISFSAPTEKIDMESKRVL